MKEYNALSNNTKEFELTNNTELIGKLIYKSWFKFDAEMVLTNSRHYQVVPKGFWGSTIEVKDGEQVMLQFQMSWNGTIVIQTNFQEKEKNYVFKHRGIFKEAFVLTDTEGAELLVMKPTVKWKKLTYEYHITTADAFDAIPQKEILLVTALHCANYYMSIMTAQ